MTRGRKQAWSRAAVKHNDGHLPKEDNNNDSRNDSDHYLHVRTLVTTDRDS